MSPTWAALCLVAGGWIAGWLCHMVRMRRVYRQRVQFISYARKRRDWGKGA